MKMKSDMERNTSGQWSGCKSPARTMTHTYLEKMDSKKSSTVYRLTEAFQVCSRLLSPNKVVKIDNSLDDSCFLPCLENAKVVYLFRKNQTQ